MWPVVKEFEFSLPPHFEPLERARTKFLKFGMEIVGASFVGQYSAAAIGDRGVQPAVVLRHHQRETVVTDEVGPKVLVLREFLAIGNAQRQTYCPCPRWCGLAEPFFGRDCVAFDTFELRDVFLIPNAVLHVSERRADIFFAAVDRSQLSFLEQVAN